MLSQLWGSHLNELKSKIFRLKTHEDAFGNLWNSGSSKRKIYAAEITMLQPAVDHPSAAPGPSKTNHKIILINGKKDWAPFFHLHEMNGSSSARRASERQSRFRTQGICIAGLLVTRATSVSFNCRLLGRYRGGSQLG